MGFDLHTVAMPNGFGPQRLDRLQLALASLSVPAAGAAVVSLGSITAGSGFDVLPSIAPTGGTLTSGVSPAVPAVVRATSLKCVTATVATPGTGVAINDTFLLAGGTLAVAGPGGNALGTAGATTKLTATHIKAVSAVVNAGGASGTAGPVTITGTTGTGTPFQATGTISAGGALTGPLVVTVPGDYTVGPTSLAAEPITGGSLSGATVTLVMGALTFAITTAGGYTVAPTTPNAPADLVGTGAGVTATVSFGLGTAVIDESGNYSSAPSWTVTANDANGSGASIATGSLGSSGNAVIRQIPIEIGNMAGANVQATAQAALDAVCSVQSKVGGYGAAVNPNDGPPYVSISIQPRLAANTLGVGFVDVMVAA